MLIETVTTEHRSHTSTAGTIPERMRAMSIVAPGKAEIVDVPVVEPGPGEVLVRLSGCGVCASNEPVWEGREWFKYPIDPGAPGHEGWGRVAAVGAEVTSVRTGDPVALLSYHAYAEFDTAPESAVVPLPAELADIPFPGEPLGCALNIFDRSGIEEGQTVAIIGIGYLGALLTELATQAGARVIALSRRVSALEWARRYGASECIPMDDHWRIIDQIKELTGGRFCERTIEATGKQWPLDLAGELTAERGRLVVAGYHQDGPRSVNMQLWNWRGLDVINAHERDQAVYISGIRKAVETVRSGRLHPEPLHTHTYGLDQMADAFGMLRERPDGFMKALIDLSHSI